MQIVGVATGAPASVAAFTASFPAAYTATAGDRSYIFVCGKYDSASMSSASGWDATMQVTGGTGSTGNDSGPTQVQVLIKDLAGGESAPSVTPGSFNSLEWLHVIARPDSGNTFVDATTDFNPLGLASDTNTASPLTGTTGAFAAGYAPTAGDGLFIVGVVPTDLGTALGATTVTCTGLSGGTVTAPTTNYIENALGADTATVWAQWLGFTGTATAGVAVSLTVTGATNQSGVIAALSIRQQAAAAAARTPIVPRPVAVQRASLF